MAVVGVSTVNTNYRVLGPLSATELKQDGPIAKRIIAPGAATYQLKKSESGSVVLFDSVAVAFTLPEIVNATDLGMFFDFRTVVTTTSAHSITTKVTSEFIVGEIMAASETAGAQDAFAANGTSHVTISMNGTTKGGLIGDAFRLTAVTLTQWLVEGYIMTSGTAATPFA